MKMLKVYFGVLVVFVVVGFVFVWMGVESRKITRYHKNIRALNMLHMLMATSQSLSDFRGAKK